MSLPVLSISPVTIRHIKQGSGAGAVVVLGATLMPQPRKGVNGRRGYQSGTYEPPLNEEGTATVNLPNTVGEDGILHRRRFLILTSKAYHPGDEWIEVRQGNRVLFVGTPIGATKTRGQITLRLADGQWLLRKQRETAAGFWCHAPRDAFEHYTKAWTTLIADDFTAGADAARWTKDTTKGTVTDNAGYVRCAITIAGFAAVGIKGIGSFWGTVPAGTNRAWRAELLYDRTGCVDMNISFAMADDVSGALVAYVTLLYSGSAGQVTISSDTTSAQRATDFAITKTGATMAIESRDRFFYFYVDGQLVGVLENTSVSDASRHLVPRVAFSNSAGAISPGRFLDVQSILVRSLDPLLMRGADNGDYRLPGSMPPGGLQGAYFDDADLRTLTSTQYLATTLNPTRQPYARRQDAALTFSSGSPVAFQPPGPPAGEYFSARWTGAIFLDLAAADITLRLTQFNYSVRLWLGKTMFGEELLTRWAAGGAATISSGSLRTHLGASLAGWYPIRIDWVHNTGANGLTLQQSIGGGAYAAVPSSSLSPYGIYDTNVRYDSHAEQLKAIADTFGIQYRCEPRSLESGLFPGEVVPRVRVGRDTDKVLEPAESTDVAIEINAEDVSDTLLADAAGISDPANAAQLTAENIDYGSIRETAVVDRHLAVLSEYESLTDITDPGLLKTRLDSLLGLRSSPWEEVSARPHGHRERRDTFPLTGALALFAWEPGDAIRVRSPDLDLDDLTPRQIIAPSWPFGPDGLGAPAVRFRQRPRSQQTALRVLVRSALLPQRNYQGTLTTVQGSLGSTDVREAPDEYTRVALPTNATNILDATLLVMYKADTSTKTIEVNGTATTLTLLSTGQFDVTAYAAAAASTAYMYVRLTGGTGGHLIRLDLTVRI